MNALNYYVMCSHIQVLNGQQAYLASQIVLFDSSNSVIDTQRPKRCSIEILVENEMTEQMNNETAQQESERTRL